MTQSREHLAGGFGSVLLADKPRPELADRLHTFGQFVGSWDLVVTFYDPDGSSRIIDGEWHFGWMLDGQAVGDVWIAPSRATRLRDGVTGEWGHTLRFFDPAIDAWRSTWMGPYRGWVRPFIGRDHGEEIVLEGSFAPGVTTRWIFSDVTSEAFRWRAEVTTADDTRIIQTFAATRA